MLLLEAGGRDNWIWFHIPVGYLFAIGNPRSDWMFKTEAVPGLNGRALNYPRGKVIGGSSSINAMIYMRGQAADYDHWRQLGLTGWGWHDVLPVFKQHEHHFLGASEHHAVGGEWRIEHPRVRWDLLDAFRTAAEQAGIKRIDDFNTGDNEGSAPYHVNQKFGRRWSAARGFLKPALNRANLRLETGCLVERVEFDGRRAVGVRFKQNGETKIARCRGEVILSAGSIGSIQTAAAVRRRPAAHLQQFGIPVVLDKPGVGENLQDHLQLRMIYKVTGIKTLNEMYASLFGRAQIFLDYALRRRGPLTMAPSQLGIFTRSDPSRERANLQYHVQPLSLDRFGEPLHTFPAFTASVTNVQPTSRGFVRLKLAIRPTSRRSSRIICRPTRTGASPPIRSASRGGSCRSRRWRLTIRTKFCPARWRAATTTQAWSRPPATSAPRSSIRSAPPRWAATAIRWRWWTSGCACSGSNASA